MAFYSGTVTASGPQVTGKSARSPFGCNLVLFCRWQRNIAWFIYDYVVIRSAIGIFVVIVKLGSMRATVQIAMPVRTASICVFVFVTMCM